MTIRAHAARKGRETMTRDLRDNLVRIAERDAEIARLRAELALWKPMTPAEAQAAYDAAEAVPLSEEEIQRILDKVTDPAERLNNAEEAQLHVVVARSRKQKREAVEACRGLVELLDAHGWGDGPALRAARATIAEAERTRPVPLLIGDRTINETDLAAARRIAKRPDEDGGPTRCYARLLLAYARGKGVFLSADEVADILIGDEAVAQALGMEIMHEKDAEAERTQP